MKRLFFIFIVLFSLTITVKGQKIGDKFKDEKGKSLTIIRKQETKTGYLFELIDDNKGSILVNKDGLKYYQKIHTEIPKTYTFNEISSSYQRYDRLYRRGKFIAITGGVISAIGLATNNNKITVCGGIPMIIGCSICTFTYPIPNKIKRRHKK